MRRVLRTFVVASVAAALSGAVSLATPIAAETHAACQKPTHHCQELTITCACCPDTGAPGPAVPARDLTTGSNHGVSDGAFMPFTPALASAALASSPDRTSTHRAGPPLSLSILHASLLL